MSAVAERDAVEAFETHRRALTGLAYRMLWPWNNRIPLSPQPRSIRHSREGNCDALAPARKWHEWISKDG